MDMISSLPNPLISQILSYLSTKEAASTSILSKRWRFLFTSVTNLEFECDDEDSPSFIEFVDRVLALQGSSTLNRFSLNCSDYSDPDPDRVTSWIMNGLRRGVSDLDLSLSETEYHLPSKIFMSKILVKLKLGPGNDMKIVLDLVDVYLPKLKILDLDSVMFEEEGLGFAKLLCGCPVLEELVMMNIGWGSWNFCYVSVTLKKLKVFVEEPDDENLKSVSFDTPNLEYLEYSDVTATKYPKVNFDSLVEAHIGLQLSEEDEYFSEEEDGYFCEGDDDEEKKMVGNATDFLMGICNVQILFFSSKALEVLASCCKATPIFNNLIQLTIESDSEIRWDSLPSLLKNCPNLVTLVFKGLLHKCNKKCGNLCVCKRLKKPSCLSSSPVKVLKIIMTIDIDDEGMELEQIKHFLETMPRLEHLIVYYNISYDPAVFELSKKLQNVPRIASPKCKVQVISQNLSLSSTLPSSILKKWPAPPKEECSLFLKALI